MLRVVRKRGEVLRKAEELLGSRYSDAVEEEPRAVAFPDRSLAAIQRSSLALRSGSSRATHSDFVPAQKRLREPVNAPTASRT